MPTALNEMSTRPALSITDWRCRSTACASSASTVESVNSALKRACASLQRRQPPTDEREPAPVPDSTSEQALVAGFGIRHGTGLFILTLTGDRICAFTRFDNSVLPWFGLPRSLPSR
jgi:hypothetical protein